MFAEVFCKARGATCLNLGRSGTDTFDQVRILRRGIDTHRLRPKTVVLTMLAACWLGAAGNDLGDNLAHAGPRSALPAPMRAELMPSLGDIVKAIQRRVVDFEITKRVMIIATSGLKSSLYACSPQTELDAAQRATAAALRQLAGLADEYGFKVDVVVIHPYQELDGALPVDRSGGGRRRAGEIRLHCDGGSAFARITTMRMTVTSMRADTPTWLRSLRRAGGRDARAGERAMSKLNGR